jgi:ABC-2 type transport system permease protein
VRITWWHTRFHLLEAVRAPAFVLSLALLPTLTLLFFVVPFHDVTGSPAQSTSAIAQLTVFSVATTYLFTFGLGVAADRDRAWEPFVRTLPVGVGPQLAGRVISGVLLIVVGLVPLTVAGAALTAATSTPLRLLAAGLALLAAGLPLLFGGLALGYTLRHRTASAVAQLVLFPLAFGGGLFLPPRMFPGWLDALSRWLPTRSARDLVVSAVTGSAVPLWAVTGVAAWTLLTGGLAVTAFLRDQGQRFR